MSEPSTIPSGAEPPPARLWAERIARWAQSGLSATAFCDAEHITKSNFFRWKRRLANPATHTGTTPRSPTSKTRPPKTAVVPVRLTPPHAHAAIIELAFPSGTVLRLPAEVRPELIVAILRGLEQQPC